MLATKEAICTFPHSQDKCDVIRSYMCFQYTSKLRHNVVYVSSIFYGDGQLPNGYDDFINRP